jgi:L-ribulose-5-phosphate 3-epimerase
MKHGKIEVKTFGRREFMAKTTLAAGVAAGMMSGIYSSSIASAATKRQIAKSLKFSMIKADGMSIEQKFGIAKAAGFDSVEPGSIGSKKVVREYAKAAEKHDLPVDALICSAHWGKPLTDANPDVYNVTVKDMRECMENVKELGGDMVLLVPAVVNPQTSYKYAWTRSIERTKMLAEDAERLGITIGIENVWNKFLLSPLEAAAFIDEIDSKYVKFWFDVGNVVQFAYPEDWIRTLGDRIARVDIKDFKRNGNQFCKLSEGDVNWKEVMKAFDEIGFTKGIFAAEVGGGNQEYLTKYVSKPMDDYLGM